MSRRIIRQLAHEVRNPLTAIRSTVQYVFNGLPTESPHRELLEEMMSEIDRIDETVG